MGTSTNYLFMYIRASESSAAPVTPAKPRPAQTSSDDGSDGSDDDVEIASDADQPDAGGAPAAEVAKEGGDNGDGAPDVVDDAKGEGDDASESEKGEVVENPIFEEKKTPRRRKSSKMCILPTDEIGDKLAPYIWREEGFGRVSLFFKCN